MGNDVGPPVDERTAVEKIAVTGEGVAGISMRESDGVKGGGVCKGSKA
jgi:hypothetical protein